MVMLTNRLAKFLVETPGLESLIILTEGGEDFKGPDGPSQEDIDRTKALVFVLGKGLLEMIDRYCDPSAGPLHELVLEMKAEIGEKMQTMLFPTKDDLADEVVTRSDRAFKVAVKATAHSVEQHRGTSGKGFHWFTRLHFQRSLFLFLVGQLSTRKSGAAGGEGVGHGAGRVRAVPRPVRRVAEGALPAGRVPAARVAHAAGGAPGADGLRPETPECVLRVQALMPQEEPRSEPSPADGGAPTVDGTCETFKSDETMATDEAVDQVLGLGLDGAVIDWETWGSMVAGPPTWSAFGGFAMGPTTEW